MKRRITDLEKKLLENGYTLTSKLYKGKHSEKTCCYVYKNGHNAIKLDYTRTNVIDFAVLVLFVDCAIDKVNLAIINNAYNLLNEFVNNLMPQDKKVIVVPNSEIDERDELGAMTPEQFDELCLEMENKDENKM